MSNSKLEELKKKTIDLSNKQYELRNAITSKEQDRRLLTISEDDINKEMFDLMNKMMASSRTYDVAEREKTNNRLDLISENQRATNEQLNDLRQKLDDSTSLNALYEAKRKALELNYQEEESTLKERLNSLKIGIANAKQELDDLTNEKRIKKFIIFVFKVLITILVIILLILFIEWLGNGISGFFNNVVNAISNMVNDIKRIFAH